MDLEAEIRERKESDMNAHIINPIETGYYGVVHFGEDVAESPMYMNQGGTFTSNINKAMFTHYRDEVDRKSADKNDFCRNEGHPLAGKIFPVRILVDKVEMGDENDAIKVPSGVEDMMFFWFTFGFAHPLDKMVQGVYATSETKAREVMSEFYGNKWAACYGAIPTARRQYLYSTVSIGGEDYHPIPMFLKEGDLYQ